MDIPSPRVPLCPSHKALPPRSLCSSPPLSGGAPSSRRRSGPVALRPAPSCLVGWCAPVLGRPVCPALPSRRSTGGERSPDSKTGPKPPRTRPTQAQNGPATRRRRPTATPAPGTPPEREGGGRRDKGGRALGGGARGALGACTQGQPGGKGDQFHPLRVTPKKMTAFIIAVGSCIRSFGKA